MVEGHIRGLSQYYSNGLERMEIRIDKKHASSLPCQNNQRIPITLMIGEKNFVTGLRSTPDNDYVWICPDLKDTLGRKSCSLAQALLSNDFQKNQKVKLVFDGNIARIEPISEIEVPDKSRKIADHCKRVLDLANAKLSEEFFYNSLALCVIDAVFSLGISYTATRNVVKNFCSKLKIKMFRHHGSKYPKIESQFSMEALLSLYQDHSFEELADIIFKNHNRTSPRNGILKSEAVFRFASVLHTFGVNYFQDIPLVIESSNFESSIRKIPGQSSGLSTKYFYMLAGGEDFIKPDRMIIRFVESVIQEKVDSDKTYSLILDALTILKKEFPALTPRMLDHEIWKYQQNL